MVLVWSAVIERSASVLAYSQACVANRSSIPVTVSIYLQQDSHVFHFCVQGNPCVNGGTCYPMSAGRKKRQANMPMGYYCQCLYPYTGTRCEQYISLCASNPCRNNGTCFQDTTANRIYCLCTPSFTGTLCDISTGVQICATNPSICVNGGTCRVNTSLAQGYLCVCPPAYTGFFCEQTIDPCRMLPAPCLNNGTCVSSASVVYLSTRHEFCVCVGVIADDLHLHMSARLHRCELLDTNQSLQFTAVLPQRHVYRGRHAIVPVRVSDKLFR